MVVKHRGPETRQRLRFLGRETADPDLGDRREVEAAPHRAGVIVNRPHVGVAHVGVRINLQDRQLRMPSRGGRDERRRDRVFAAERDEKLVAPDHLVGHALDFVDERLHLAERQLHFRQREDADAVHVGLHLFIP